MNPSENLKRQKKIEHFYTEDSEKMSKFGRLMLLGIVFMTAILMSKQILNMSWSNVVAHPTHLITNFAPKKLTQLDKRHGRVGESNSENSNQAPVYTAIQNTYTVKDGETLSSIAEKANVSVQAIMDANHLSDQIVSPGQVLTLPVER